MEPPRVAISLSYPPATLRQRVSALFRARGIDRPLAVMIAVDAVLLFAFVKLADDALEGDTRTFDETVLLALRMPGDISQPVGVPPLAPGDGPRLHRARKRRLADNRHPWSGGLAAVPGQAADGRAGPGRGRGRRPFLKPAGRSCAGLSCRDFRKGEKSSLKGVTISVVCKNRRTGSLS